ncbi:MAG: dephospho-CoA kinase [Proteobacteria bacterium]|nr:MAG: dephospho-CoA kinase [Pseudomonadota bacterium]
MTDESARDLLPAMKIFGLTGGIAAGKSTVGRYLASMGAPVIDADEIARELRKPGGAAATFILARFGTLEADELRKLIHENIENKIALEQILHPLIREESAQRFLELKAQGHELAVYEASQLIERGRHRDFDGTILVTAPLDARVARLASRNGWSGDHARQAIALQLSDEEKYASAQWIIRNDGSLDALYDESSRLLDELRIAASFPFPLR